MCWGVGCYSSGSISIVSSWPPMGFTLQNGMLLVRIRKGKDTM